MAKETRFKAKRAKLKLPGMDNQENRVSLLKRKTPLSGKWESTQFGVEIDGITASQARIVEISDDGKGKRRIVEVKGSFVPIPRRRFQLFDNPAKRFARQLIADVKNDGNPVLRPNNRRGPFDERVVVKRGTGKQVYP